MTIEDDFEVLPCYREDVLPWLLQKHYAHRLPSISKSFGLFDKTTKKMVGVITYGEPVSRMTRFVCGEGYEDLVIEPNRLIKNDGLPPNTQTWFVGQTFKLLKKPVIIISYADPNHGHTGITYKGTNFLYTGKSTDEPELLYKGRVYSRRHINEVIKTLGGHPDLSLPEKERWIKFGGTIVEHPEGGKHRYVLFIGSKTWRKNAIKALKWPVLPYPKGKNTKYDTSQNIVLQTTLPDL